MDWSRIRRAAGACLLLLATLSTWPAAAQSLTATDRAELRRQFDELFGQMLREPDNLDLTFHYADVAARLGDYEAAITALERMLLYNPDLPRVQLELGVLYFRLGSYKAAETYLRRAISGPDVPPQVRARVERYLAEAERRQAVVTFSGLAFAGIQHQTDANAAPASPNVRVLGVDATLADQFTKQADQNLFANVFGILTYDLGDQEHDTIEATATGFASKYFRQDRLDVDFIEATVGPRFTLGRFGLDGASVHPYAIANYVLLGHAPFFQTYGLGLDAEQPITRDLDLRLLYEHREKNYHDDRERPTSRQFTGHEDIVDLALSFLVTRNQALDLTLAYRAQSTRLAGSSNHEYGATLAYRIAYAPPFGDPSLRWQSSIAVGRFSALYDAPDPFVDPNTTRHDLRWRFGFSQTLPVTPDVAIILQAQREIVSSTLPNFAYTNTAVLIGPQVRF